MKSGTRQDSYSPGNAGNGPVLITGGCGFIGANLAHRLLSSGKQVILYDNFSRDGVKRNYQWLRKEHGDEFLLQAADTRDMAALSKAVAGASAVFHFAAQVAVTISNLSPVTDFEINARGTLNLLEALRQMRRPPPLIYTSTNKVYGALSNVELALKNQRYEAMDMTIRTRGIDEMQRLDFYSPYGCSKGAADQYVLEYARTFGLPALVFRMSCIYGPQQYGNEDQGWVAHFLLQALKEQPITLYGDGCQVRDILFIDDLIDALLIAHERIDELSGQAFNIGGGVANTISLLELMDMIGELNGGRPQVEWGDWRAGDQRFYVSNIAKFRQATDWKPAMGIREGVQRLHAWLHHATSVPALAAR